MAVAVSEIMSRAAYILNDAGAVRWTPQEMLLWINDGQRAVVIGKPSANTETSTISLAAGTRQAVPASASQLVRILRNTDGPAITMVDREIMDAHVPGWGDTTVWPADAIVEHAIYDRASPEAFDVFPANDGTGEIEAVIAVLPSDIAEPGSNPDQIASYTDNIGIPDSYREALVNYLVYRAFSKDAEYPDSAQRAAAHYQTFAAAVGLKAQIEARDNPDMAMGG